MHTGPTVQKHDLIRFADGEPFGVGTVGGRFKVAAAATEGRFVVAEMPDIPPRTLAAPLHCHNKEDEYTYVLAGALGVMAGDEALTVGPGSWLIKPRGEWHTFWNPGDTPEDPCILFIAFEETDRRDSGGGRVIVEPSFVEHE